MEGAAPSAPERRGGNRVPPSRRNGMRRLNNGGRRSVGAVGAKKLFALCSPVIQGRVRLFFRRLFLMRVARFQRPRQKRTRMRWGALMSAK